MPFLLSDKPVKTNRELAHREPAAPPLRILVAEDNDVSRLLVVRLLEKHGHTVLEARTGLEALVVLEKGDVDVILMDIQMPDLDGLQATAEIREREAGTGRHVPIIALTAHAIKGDRERCLESGMDDYLSKPIQPADLMAALGRACASRQPLAEV